MQQTKMTLTNAKGASMSLHRVSPPGSSWVHPEVLNSHQKKRVLQLRRTEESRTEMKRCLTEVLIALDHFECSGGDAGTQSCLFVFPKSCIHVLFRLQGVPLGNGAARVGQHIGPVPQLCAGGVVAHKDLADGFVLPQLVIIQHSDYNLHFLGEERKKRAIIMKDVQAPPKGTQGRNAGALHLSVLL